MGQPIGRLPRIGFMAKQVISGQRLIDSLRTLMRLEHTMKRIGDENFGACAECGEDIAIGRLVVIPEAMRCVVCAESVRP